MNAPDLINVAALAGMGTTMGLTALYLKYREQRKDRARRRRDVARSRGWARYRTR